MENSCSYKFPKSEKVCNVKEISLLFRGESLFVYPFKIGYIIKENGDCLRDVNRPKSAKSTIKVLCSVGKRYSKSAVKRNLIKRRIREAYRLNRHILSESTEAQILLAFIFVSQKEESYEQIEKSMVKALRKIAELVEKSSNICASSAD
ncbi:MAG: ribonuclease P protein component [Rikenellaceae bacterium]